MTFGSRECPKCGLQMAGGERVCRRCKYFVEEGRFLNLEPMTLSPSREAPKVMTPQNRLRSWWQRRPEVSSRSLYAAAVIPGLAHLICRERRGWSYLGGVLALLVGGLMLLPGAMSQMLIGLAAGVHAYSIFTLTPYSQTPVLWVRIIAITLLSLILSFVLYYPLIARFVPGEGLYYTYRQDGRFGTAINYNPVWMLVGAIMIGAFVFLVVAVGRMMSKK